jgi:hypothetical protein
METLDGKTDYSKIIAGFSVISSKIFAEGSIGDAKYVLSVRRTYYDVVEKIYKMVDGKDIDIPTYFYDIFGKATYPISKNFIIKAESFFSHDYYDFSGWRYRNTYIIEKDTNPFWNTFMLNISGFYSMSDISFLKLGWYLSQSILKADMRDALAMPNLALYYQDTNIVYIDNKIKDVSFYIENDLIIKKHNIKSGIEYKQINLAYNWLGDSQGLRGFAGNIPPPDLLFDYAPNIFDSSKAISIFTVYTSDFFELMPRLFSNIGFRFSYLSNLSLSHFTPFINLKYYFTHNFSLNVGYSSYYQYLYAIRENLNKTGFAFSPMSALFLADDKENIPASKHFSFGIELLDLFSNYTLNAEVYLKDYSNLIASYNVEPVYRYEDGRSYGIDILFRKPVGFLTGWIAYTLSKSFKENNEGIKYYTSYDRTHNLKIIGDFNISSVFKIGFQYNYATGLVYTPVTSASFSFDHSSHYSFMNDQPKDFRIKYGLKNSERSDNYSRLDLSMTGAFAWNNFVLKPYISVINVLNSQNFFSVNYIHKSPGHVNREEEISSFIIPTIGITAEYQF